MMSKVRVKFFGLIIVCLCPFILFGYWFNAKPVPELKPAMTLTRNLEAAREPLESPKDPTLRFGHRPRQYASGRRRDRSDDAVVIYNRVPKTGSTSFVGLAYTLCRRSKYHVIHINVTRNDHVLSLPNQMQFVHNVTRWKPMRRALYHGHFGYVDFSKFLNNGGKQPYYINIVRDPLERFVSYYYFLRFGDDFRPHLKRRRMRNKKTQMQTFDECVQKKGYDCDQKKMWIQVPFFCGQAAYCWSEPGSRLALETAKRNLVTKYLLVGITEEMEDFVRMIEVLLPRFFAGASALYAEGSQGNRASNHMRKTFGKKALLPETHQAVKQWPVWQAEQEFYEFAREQFHFTRQFMFWREDGSDAIVWSKQKFRYDKIRPRTKPVAPPSGE